MDTGQLVVVGIAILFLAAFMIGITNNDRQARRINKWLQDGTKGLGTLSAPKWFGSPRAGAFLTLQNPRRPFAKVDLLFSLETRENLPLWVIRRLAGRRDLLIIQASIKPAPEASLTITPVPKHKPGQEGEAPLAGFDIQRQNPAEPVPAGVERFLERYGQGLVYLALKAESPHLVARIKLPSLLEQEGRKFFKDLGELASIK